MVTTWCLIDFHGNHNHINDVNSGHHLGFSNFQNSFIFELNTEYSEKTTSSDCNLQNCKTHCKVVSILAKIVTLLAKIELSLVTHNLRAKGTYSHILMMRRGGPSDFFWV